VTLLPIAYDYQVASKSPESPNVKNLLILATVLGCCQTGVTMLFAYGIPYISIFQDQYTLTRRDISLSGCNDDTQAIIWIQVFVATEILAFSTRAPSYFFLCRPPTWPLTAGIVIGCLIICFIASFSTFGNNLLPSTDVALVWVWNIFWFFVIDAIKVQMLLYLNESTEVLPELVVVESDVFTSSKSLHLSTVAETTVAAVAAVPTININTDASGRVVVVDTNNNNNSSDLIGMPPGSEVEGMTRTDDNDDEFTVDDMESYAFRQREISQLGKLVMSEGSTRNQGLGQTFVDIRDGAILVRGFSQSSSRSILSSNASFR